MFTAYFDESGHSAGTEFVSVGGFVGDAEQWRLFDQRWNEALAPYGLEHFHMREVRGLVPKDQQPALAAALVGVIGSVDIIGAGAVMKVADFHAFPQEVQDEMRDPFYTLFQEAVAGSAVLAQLEPRETKVDLVWDQNKEFGGSAEPVRNFVCGA